MKIVVLCFKFLWKVFLIDNMLPLIQIVGWCQTSEKPLNEPATTYRQTSNISHTLVCNKLADHSDVVGAGPIGAVPTTSSSSTKQLTSIDCAKTIHDNVIKRKHFPRYWPFVRGIHQLPVNSPHKGQWRGALMVFFYLRLNKLLSKQLLYRFIAVAPSLGSVSSGWIFAAVVYGVYHYVCKVILLSFFVLHCI